MSDTARRDALVIGGSAGGLIAAAYLARAGRSVTLLESGDGVGASHTGVTLQALDPQAVKDLKLVRQGIKFAARDVPLVGLSPDGRHLVIGRDVHAATRSIATLSQGDAEAFAHFRREIFALARALRPWWWEARESGNAMDLLANTAQRRLLAQLRVTSAAALLDGWFESDLLKASLAFDVSSPFEAGSALALVWRAAQEMCGLQGAVAVPLGGMSAFGQILMRTAQFAGAKLRTKARVARLVLADDAVAGVELESGERIFAPVVLSAVSRRATLLELAPPASVGLAATQALAHARRRIGEAVIDFTLNAPPSFTAQALPMSGRFVLAERLENYAATGSAARAGRLFDELVLEAIVPTHADPGLAPLGQHILSVRVRDLPVAPAQGSEAMQARLLDKVIAMLDRQAPGLKTRIVGYEVRMPEPGGDLESAGRILAASGERIRTPIEGLLLCGSAAEPVSAVSGRAARFAASMALHQLSRAP